MGYFQPFPHTAKKYCMTAWNIPCPQRMVSDGSRLAYRSAFTSVDRDLVKFLSKGMRHDLTHLFGSPAWRILLPLIMHFQNLDINLVFQS
jgi:hypothetical protein